MWVLIKIKRWQKLFILLPNIKMIDYIKKTTGNKSHFETYHTGRKTSKWIQLNYKQKITEAVQQLQSYWEVWKELAKVLLSKQEFTEEYLKSLWKEEKLGKMIY